MVQLLCPSRHCVIGLAYQSPDGTANPEAVVHLKAMFDLMVAGDITTLGVLNPWCGLCKSKDLRAEDEATVFTTMDEAKPMLDELEREQAATRTFWEASKG